METLTKEFGDAVERVRIKGEKAARAMAAHLEVRGILELNPTLRGWGIDTILIGSYGRRTGRYPGKDVDVFLRFTKLTNADDPSVVYDTVRDVLVAKFGHEQSSGRVSEQARSLKIAFSGSNVPDDEEFSVDAVPAVVWGSHWGIPNRDRTTWSGDGERWVRTDPVEFGQRTDTLATSSRTATVDGINAYRRVVRFMRQIRQQHLGDSKPGGLEFEVATYWAWTDGAVAGSSYAELLANTFSPVAAQFRDAASRGGLVDPVLGTVMQPPRSANEWLNAASLCDSFAHQSAQALNADKCRAAKIWRDILGSNDRGPILPLPQGCDANGMPVGPVTAVNAVGSNQPRGFA